MSEEDHAASLRRAVVEIEELHAEIERLRASLEAIDDHGRALAFVETLKEKDAEIERLTKTVEYSKWSVDQWAQKDKKLKQLITELAGWVKVCIDQRRVTNPELLKLLQRTREATKDE